MSDSFPFLRQIPLQSESPAARRRVKLQPTRKLRQLFGRATSADIASALAARGLSTFGSFRSDDTDAVEIQITHDVFVRVDARMCAVAWFGDMPRPYPSHHHSNIRALVSDIHQARAAVAEYLLEGANEAIDATWTGQVAADLVETLARDDVPGLTLAERDDGTARTYIAVRSIQHVFVEIMDAEHFQVVAESNSGLQLQFPIRDSVSQIRTDIAYACTYVFPEPLPF
jgi:hypothetical protein